MDGHNAESQKFGAPGITNKKGKKTSKLRTTPVSFTDGASPKSPRRNSHQHKERFSGLWEFFYEGEEEGANQGPTSSGERGTTPAPVGGRQEDDKEEGVLKNIRGFLFKRRKSPLKGWHKRYFTLQGGILTCSRNKVQMSKGKVLSRTDLGFAVITCDSVRWKIDIDEERQVYHLKTKNASHFAAWSSCLLAHELWRKAQLSGTDTGLDLQGEGEGGREGGRGGGGEVEEWAQRAQETINNLKNDLDAVKEHLDAMGVCVKSPVLKPTDRSGDSGSEGSSYVHQNSSEATAGGGGGKEKEKRRWGRKKHEKRSNKDNSANVSDLQSVSQCSIPLNQSVSFVSSSDDTIEDNIIRDDFSTTANIVFAHFKEMFEKWDKVQTGFEKCVERERADKQRRQTLFANQQLMLRQALLQNAELKDRLSRIQALATGLEPPAPTSSIKTPRPRTPASHSQSFTSSLPTGTGSSLPRFNGPVGKSLSRFDSFVSVRSTMSETFFDALDDVNELSSEEDDQEEGEYTIEEEHEPSDSEEEEEEEDSAEDLYASLTADAIHSLTLSPRKSALKNVSPLPPLQNSDRVNNTLSPTTERGAGGGGLGEKGEEEMVGGGGGEEEDQMMRRTQLPCLTPEMADFSLWSILRKNIGKDLSRVSMPVSLNEPLSALQRLCEEVQYSELLDQAAELDNPYDRMVKVAAFAVSAYVTAYHRPARKPFNPILGETYEWVREDKGFKFMAEQVSHHPPIAACHCESPNFTFWEDLRIKSKFWGKSMEVLPVGTINVSIPKHRDHYEWEKVTSCIHNVLGGQRWVDQYGQMTITNGGKCSCKLTFVKASYWSSKKYRVHGDVYDEEGEKVRHLFGTWHEAMFCGEEEGEATPIWQAAPMPEDSEQYYGFNEFAVQLNGIEAGMREKLPHTDSRFRPDQRLLEEGYIDQAEHEKHRVEQIQRQARAERERLGKEWSPTFFRREMRKGEECWVSRHNYWIHRDNGFKNISLPNLW